MDSDTIITALTVWLPQIITVASIVVRLTPTELDNQILEYLLKAAEVIALNRK